MAERDDCFAELLKAIKDRKDRKYVQDRLDEIDERVNQDGGPGSTREKYFRAAKEMLEEQAEQRAVFQRNLRMDALKFRDLRTYIEAAAAAPGGSYQMGIEARLVGVHTPFFDPKSRQGNQASAGALSLGAQRDWIGGAVNDIRRLERDNPKFAGLEHLFYSKAIEDQIFIEKVELERQAKGHGARVGRTKNEQALEIAKILQKWDKEKIRALNSEGAWITEHSAFAASVMHDPDKMAGAAGSFLRRAFRVRDSVKRNLWEEARQAWVAATLPRIDAKRMFGTAEDADKKLAEMFGGLVTGDHLELKTVGEDPRFFNVASHVSAERSFVWKTAEDQLAYMRQFGRYGPTDAWLYGMRDSANKYALLKVFGSKPKEQFEEILAYAMNRLVGKPEKLELQKWEPALRNRYAVVSGEADRPVANAWAGIVNGVMSVQRLAKLGLTPFAQLVDNATISRELAYQGINFFERNGGLFSGYFQGAEGSAKREVAELLHAGVLGRLRGITSRFDIADGAPGVMAKLENTFFKWTGMTPMTENKRADAERLMAFHMGKQRGKAFAELGTAETRILQAFGIGDKEWALLQKATWNEIAGATYLTPDVALKLKDADVKEYLGAGGGSISERAASLGPNAPDIVSKSSGPLERARQDLAMKLWAYYGERGNHAVIEFGPKEKAILYQGTQSQSPLQTALRLLLQFKQFPTAMITKVWGREIYGGAKGMDRVAGITELIVSTTLFGMLANFLNQTAKGQDPTSVWRNHPAQAVMAGFLRGGAASIYGDFLLGEWSRHGQQAAETLLGPTVGQVNQVTEIWADLTHMKGRAATAALGARMVRNNTPFANMIYTKAAIDYLVFYRFMEWLNPGYLERMERSAKEKQGIEFMLRPTQIAR
jgi:hypothetical protein